MANYALYENTSSPTYGATSDRPIAFLIQAEPDVIAAQVPTGYDYLEVADGVSPDSHYIGGLDVIPATPAAYPKFLVWEDGVGPNGGWWMTIYINAQQLGVAITAAPTEVGPETYVVNGVTWTANGTAEVRFDNQPLGSTYSIRVDNTPGAARPNRYLSQPSGGTYVNTYDPYESMRWTTTLGTWYPVYGGTANTTYRFTVNNPRFKPFTLLIEAA